ncbi:type IX secretion system motor protein PorM/GldM [Haloflavibacter putidus]|uniref:Gliding motility protein GldM n=1 Tax=Haloflavibacter putidus TaxID=2576776 RepID=A0A507ZY28_9FLAO|nr:gliding motility protein GldM [Haloflavibacter putidus]TQD39675.1 gliding motility protein GldM [Haloflavibacter putidus]
MASGKETPRQKMINLMYLVFIAMMALNMSKEVLTAFGMINQSLAEANETTAERNEAFMAGLAQKASEQPEQYKPLQDKAQKVESVSKDLNNYIANLKQGALEAGSYENDEGELQYETMDKTQYFDEKFYQSKVTKDGQEFLDEIESYKNQMLQLVQGLEGSSYRSIEATIKEKFDISDVTNSEGVTKPWINYNFVGFPIIASLTKLTQMQNDIKTVENQLLSAMLQGEQASQLSMSNYQAMVVPDKSAFFSGENFTGKIVLGRYDNSLTFDKVTINGEEVEAGTGNVALDFPAGNVGEQKIEGELQFQEGDSTVTLPISDSYAVIPKPNAAVISADKMNVVYRGVKNPMTISIPGVPSVSASAPGLAKTGSSSYVMDVTNVKAKDVTIRVNGELPNGEPVSDSKKFRIKEIPRPVGIVAGRDGSGGALRMPRGTVAVAQVNASLPDFVFDLNLNVTSFKFQVVGKPIVNVAGNRLNGTAKAQLQGAPRGAVITIFDIKAKIQGNSSYTLPRISPVLIELTD